MDRCLDIIQIWCDGSPGISDDLINFCEESIKNKMADVSHFEKMAAQTACGCNILWTVGWIPFKFDVVVLSTILMLDLIIFWESLILKITWLGQFFYCALVITPILNKFFSKGGGGCFDELNCHSSNGDAGPF